MAEQVLSHIDKQTQEQITALFEKTKDNKEFEFIFFSKKGHKMNKEKYVSMIRYIKNKSKANKYTMIMDKTMDIGYSANDDNKYIIQINGDEEINKELNKFDDIQNVNYVLFRYLINKSQDNQSITLKKKVDNIDIDDLNFKIRLSEENKLDRKSLESDTYLNKLMTDKNLDLEIRQKLNDNIFFRLKERISMYIVKEKDYFIRIDLTDAKTSRNYTRVKQTASSYELEIEYGCTNKNDKKQLMRLYEETESIIKFIQNSPVIIGSTQTQKVLEYYKAMTNITHPIFKLVARQPVSLEIQHVTENLANKYAVTDKADGDRYFMIIYNNCVYLIPNTLVVRDTGIVLDKKLSKYNGSIMDGELIYNGKLRRHIFLIFDCLRIGDEDIRTEISLLERLKQSDKIVKDCFHFGNQKGFIIKDPPKLDTEKGKFDLDEISKFWGGEIVKYHTALNKDMELMTEYPLIRNKLFIPVYGIKRWEIFRYAVEYWNRYSEDANAKFSYILDGLIFQPLEQSYAIGNETKYLDYKWKPPSRNCIEFYIEFRRDKKTGEILDVYDNSLCNDNDNDDGDGRVRNKPYRICNLFVGRPSKDSEQPVPFLQNYNIPYAYLYLKDGNVRDIENKIIYDKTVVEFCYNNDNSLPAEERWIPIKTRYDKTEAVEKFGRQYGNNNIVADKIWRSMINPVLMADFVELARGNTTNTPFYDNKIKEMNAKVSHGIIIAANKENKYYQKVSYLAKTMRDFHSFMKSILIYTYTSKTYQNEVQQSVLEFGCGRGGDNPKFYYTNVASYVGVDVDAEGLKSPVDGAISRYLHMKKTKPNVPKMNFIQADLRALLDYESQLKILSGMDDTNKKLLENFFPSNTDKFDTYDRISCQFVMHYFLKDDLSWSNFKQNIKKYLKTGGYYFATTFDAHEVIKMMGKNKSITTYYDDKNGNKKKLFDIVKKYEDPKDGEQIKTGNCIDLHAAWMFDEGNYVPEYLVDIDFVKEEFEKDCDLELVDTDLFSNQMKIHKEFLVNASKYESTPETRQYLQKAGKYYEDNELNKNLHIYTNITRYMIFRRKTNNTKHKGGKPKEYNFSDPEHFRIPEMSDKYDNDFMFLNSIHKLLVSHSIIPKTVGVEEMTQTLGIEVKQDEDIDTKYINGICNKLKIDHIDDDGKKKIVMDKLNIAIVERDCNGYYDINIHGSKNPKTIILMKTGKAYKPLLKNNRNNEYKGILKNNDDVVKYLFQNGDVIE
uniref:mRNA (guanine-N(7))-methyltransferase n=1 Tax=viral metagenome TaxID=1070528 RepID=A0A6C0DZH6_9ZZZZ